MAKDERYDKVFTDPKFWSVPDSTKRLKIDSRFKDMFSDDRFCARAAKVDSRGRPLQSLKSVSSSGKQASYLEKYYDLEDVNDSLKNAEPSSKPVTMKATKKEVKKVKKRQKSEIKSNKQTSGIYLYKPNYECYSIFHRT